MALSLLSEPPAGNLGQAPSVHRTLEGSDSKHHSYPYQVLRVAPTQACILLSVMWLTFMPRLTIVMPHSRWHRSSIAWRCAACDLRCWQCLIVSKRLLALLH